MIPTVDMQSTSPSKGGVEKPAHQGHEATGSSVKRQPFDEVLSSQESSPEASPSGISERGSPPESGKSSYADGKSLPDQALPGQEVAGVLKNTLPEESSNTPEIVVSTSESAPPPDAVSTPDADGIPKAFTAIQSVLENRIDLDPTLPVSRGSQQLADVIQKFMASPVGPGGETGTTDEIDRRQPPAAWLREERLIPGLQQTLSVGKASAVSGDGVEPEMHQSLAAWRRDAEFTAGLQQALTTGKAATALESTEQFVNLETGLQKVQAPNLSQSALGSAILPASETGFSAGLKPISTLPMTTPLGASGWDNEFFGRMTVMVKSGVQEASLQLSPPELGRLEIKISTEGDLTKVMFAVENAAAREAIEQAMPRLREMLEQSGLQLAQSEVADHSQSQKGESGVTELAEELSAKPSEGMEGEEDDTPTFDVSISNSTVDYYI